MDTVSSPDELAARIEATRARLAVTTQELRHELSPSVVTARVKDDLTTRIRGFVLDDTGMPRVPVVVAGVSVAVALLGCIIVKVTK